ncbi:hypothetical protein B4064_1034 [Caldibacillus thermoamylovorans]|nr:hypothetical protein B4064_1034 [Caldibacillus thermoamylovorans]
MDINFTLLRCRIANGFIYFQYVRDMLILLCWDVGIIKKPDA